MKPLDSTKHKIATGVSYKDDRTSSCVDVFSVDSRGRKKPLKGSSIFLKGMTRKLGNTPFLAFVPHFTLDNQQFNSTYSLNTR